MSTAFLKNQIHGPSSSLVDGHGATAHHNPSLLSPPETDPMQDHLSAYEDHYSPPDPVLHETPVSRIRRLGMSNVTYTNNGLITRDSRSSQRQSKWLIMVFPPKSLNKEPPILGHTLSSAPAGRFSNGILMPLFPTLYAQLTAIAREFSMPSIAGLCLYLQVQENGKLPLTPRISDETWHILWASYFTDDHSAHHPSHGLPICGQVEFDIDLARAKWYNAWMGFAVEGMSREPSVVASHWRGESRTSFLHPDLISDDNPSPPQDTALPTLPRRPVPRPLYLHQRSSSKNSARHIFQDVIDQHENSLSSVAAAATQPFIPNALSPMVQELEEPQSSNLNTMVKKWRESSIIASAAPSNVDVHTRDPLDGNPSSDAEDEFKLDLNDFTWSISSAGPPSQSPASPTWPERLPSVHLADRMQASRCNTPTTCTSWGPPTEDEDIFKYERISHRLPSPDMGRRILDLVPLTPSTCTSWGIDDILSPVFSRSSVLALSVDVGVRVAGSAPATPSTATSWGPADTPILSSRTQTYPSSLCIDERLFDFDDPEKTIKNSNNCWPHVWPYTRSSVSSNAGTPWMYVWPYVHSENHPFSPVHTSLDLEHYPALKDLYPPQSTRVSDDVHLDYAQIYPLVKIYEPVYPFNLMEIYPEVPKSEPTATNITLDGIYPHNLELLYPIMFDEQYISSKIIATWDYPHFEIYPPIYSSDEGTHHDVDRMPWSVMSEVAYPHFDLYPPVYPFNLDYIYSKIVTDLEKQPSSLDEHRCAKYPTIILYPAVYPFNLVDIYPSVNSHFQNETAIEGPLSGLNPSISQYPVFDLYPAVYSLDLVEIYPATASTNHLVNYNVDSLTTCIALSRSQYPFFEIYPAVYPYSLTSIYAAATTEDNATAVLSLDRNVSLLGSQYPVFDIYPSLSYEYPQIVPYRTVHGQVLEENRASLQLLPLAPMYPTFNLYPPVYPFNLEMIYCPVSLFPDLTTQSVIEPQTTNFVTNYGVYPHLIIYPAGYPWSLDYVYEPAVRASCDFSNNNPGKPPIPEESKNVLETTLFIVITQHSQGYPTFALYPPSLGYPDFVLYPQIWYGGVSNTEEEEPATLAINASYPNFNLYLPQYPFMSIYPDLLPTSKYFEPAFLPQVEQRTLRSTDHCYPFFNIYPSVYPHFDLYPKLQPWIPESSPSLARSNLSIGTERHGIRLPHTSEHSTPPPVPIKPGVLKGSAGLTRSNTLKVDKPIGRRRTHHELYMAVIADVQRALEGQASGANGSPEMNRGVGTKVKPSLLRKPTAIVPRYASPPPSPKGTRTVATFTGHVSSSIHSRVQSMHLQSKSKEEPEKGGLERSRSLLSRANSSIVHDRAKLYSATEDKDKRPPPLPRKPSIKLTGSYVRDQSL